MSNQKVRAALVVSYVGCISALLTACAPRILVTKADALANAPGVYYALPKSRIESVFQVKKLTYTKGPFEAFAVEDSKTYPFLKVKLPEGATWDVVCTKDGEQKARFEIDSVTSITASGVPDPEHVYMIRLDASYFREQDITLKLTADGIPTSASLSVTDTRVDLALALAADVLKVVTLDAHSALPGGKGPGFAGSDPHQAALNELGLIAAARNNIIHKGSTTGSIAERLKALADREAELTVLWTGKLEEKISETKLAHVPSAATSTPTNEEEIGVLAPCAGVFDKKPDDVVTAWTIARKFSADAQSDGVLAKVLTTDKLHADATANPGKFEHGLVYRIPRAARYEVLLKLPEAGGTFKPKSLNSARVFVAQHGPIMYLPTRIGGKSTTTGLDFNPETGGIMVLTAKGTGTNATPVQQSMSEIVKRDDELAELERKQKILDFKKKIRDLENPPPATTTTP